MAPATPNRNSAWNTPKSSEAYPGSNWRHCRSLCRKCPNGALCHARLSDTGLRRLDLIAGEPSPSRNARRRDCGRCERLRLRRGRRSRETSGERRRPPQVRCRRHRAPTTGFSADAVTPFGDRSMNGVETSGGVTEITDAVESRNHQALVPPDLLENPIAGINRRQVVSRARLLGRPGKWSLPWCSERQTSSDCSIRNTRTAPSQRRQYTQRSDSRR